MVLLWGRVEEVIKYFTLPEGCTSPNGKSANEDWSLVATFSRPPLLLVVLMAMLYYTVNIPTSHLCLHIYPATPSKFVYMFVGPLAHRITTTPVVHYTATHCTVTYSNRT